MNRLLIGFLLIVVLSSGCSTDSTENKPTVRPVIDYEKQVFYDNTSAFVDLKTETKLSCSWATIPDNPVIFKASLISRGQTVAKETWSENFKECMITHRKHIGFEVDQKYSNFTVLVEMVNY